MASKKTNRQISISVVIPTYNAAQWLPKTIPKVASALKIAKVNAAEIIVVDDGSSDDSSSVAKKISVNYPIRVIRQKNSGRFVARKSGTEAAVYEYILFIDTRVYIAPKGLKFIIEEMANRPERKVWTSHVYLDKQANIYARFWDTIAAIAWRRYFAQPRDCSFGLKDFDHYPKGTTCFFVPKTIIHEANTWFERNTKDLRTSNDDTLLIRYIAKIHRINLNPKFSCVYHARTSLMQFIKHAHHRGRVFVDGFLRRDGNRFFWPIIFFLMLSILVLASVILEPYLLIWLIALSLVAWLCELISLIFFSVRLTDALSVFALSPVFVLTYGAGIWRATLKLVFSRRTAKSG